MGFRDGTGVESMAIDGELFEARMDRNRGAALNRARESRQDVEQSRETLNRPDGACLVCGSLSAVRPIYGERLPGCCPAHWRDARFGVLNLIRQIAASYRARKEIAMAREFGR